MQWCDAVTVMRLMHFDTVDLERMVIARMHCKPTLHTHVHAWDTAARSPANHAAGARGDCYVCTWSSKVRSDSLSTA